MKKVALIIFIFFTGCPLNIDIEGMPCTAAPDFACATGYTCRWVSGEPRCLSEGAVNPDPLLYEENFDDGVADGFTFQNEYGATWDLSNGTLNITAISDGSHTVATEGWIENQKWKNIFVQLKFKLNYFDVTSHSAMVVRLIYRDDSHQYQACVISFADGQSFSISYEGERYSNRVCDNTVLLSEGTWYTLQLEAWGDHIVCRLVEPSIQLEYDVSRDGAFMTQAGTFGLRVTDSSASIDDIVIYSEKPNWTNLISICN